jgi:hypothetical protein
MSAVPGSAAPERAIASHSSRCGSLALRLLGPTFPEARRIHSQERVSICTLAPSALPEARAALPLPIGHEVLAIMCAEEKARHGRSGLESDSRLCSGLARCSTSDCLSSRPCSQNADHLSDPVGLREDDPSRHRLYLLRIPRHVQDWQIGKSLAVGPGHRLAVGSRQANVGQQGINGCPALPEVQGLTAAGRFGDLEPASSNAATAISRTNGSSSTIKTFIRSALARVPPLWRLLALIALGAIQFHTRLQRNSKLSPTMRRLGRGETWSLSQGEFHAWEPMERSRADTQCARC